MNLWTHHKGPSVNRAPLELLILTLEKLPAYQKNHLKQVQDVTLLGDEININNFNFYSLFISI